MLKNPLEYIAAEPLQDNGPGPGNSSCYYPQAILKVMGGGEQGMKVKVVVVGGGGERGKRDERRPRRAGCASSATSVESVVERDERRPRRA